MSKLPNVTFSAGKSEYSFETFGTDISFHDIGAVYIFTKRTVKDGRGSHSALYIGETGVLGSRIKKHEKWDCVNRYGCNCICVYSVKDERKRHAIESALIAEYDPPCNRQ